MTVRTAAAIIANSQFTANRIHSIYGREATVVYPLLPHFDPRTPIPTVDKEPMVLWVGRMSPEKRPETMLEAWRQTAVRPGCERFRLLLVGDGPLRPAIEQRLEPLVATGHAQLRTNVPTPELRALYRQALLTVHLGRDEPFGLVPLESLWEATPVLADCAGGVKETVVPGETGFCLKPTSAKTLASTLEELLSRPGNLVNLGRAAAAIVRQRFSFDSTTSAIERVLTGTQRRS